MQQTQKLKNLLYELTDRKGHLLIKKITKIDVQAKNRTVYRSIRVWLLVAYRGSRVAPFKKICFSVISDKINLFHPLQFSCLLLSCGQWCIWVMCAYVYLGATDHRVWPSYFSFHEAKHWTQSLKQRENILTPLHCFVRQSRGFGCNIIELFLT